MGTVNKKYELRRGTVNKKYIESERMVLSSKLGISHKIKIDLER